jgi:hypothetical protein
VSRRSGDLGRRWADDLGRRCAGILGGSGEFAGAEEYVLGRGDGGRGRWVKAEMEDHAGSRRFKLDQRNDVIILYDFDLIGTFLYFDPEGVYVCPCCL